MKAIRNLGVLLFIAGAIAGGYSYGGGSSTPMIICFAAGFFFFVVGRMGD